MGRARKAIEALAELAPDTADRAPRRQHEGSGGRRPADRRRRHRQAQRAHACRRRGGRRQLERQPGPGHRRKRAGGQAPHRRRRGRPGRARRLRQGRAREPRLRRHHQRCRRHRGDGGPPRRTVDDGARCQDGHRSRGAALADAAVHRKVRAHLRSAGTGAGGGAAVRLGRDRRALCHQLLPRHGGAGGSQPLRAGHLGAQRGAQRRGSRRPRRGAGQGWRAAGKPGHADLHRLRQDRHAHRRQAQADRRRGRWPAPPKTNCWRWRWRSRSSSDHPLASAVVSGARERLAGRVQPPAVADVKSITGRGIEAQVAGERVLIGKPVLFSEMPDVGTDGRSRAQPTTSSSRPAARRWWCARVRASSASSA